MESITGGPIQRTVTTESIGDVHGGTISLRWSRNSHGTEHVRNGPSA